MEDQSKLDEIRAGIKRLLKRREHADYMWRRRKNQQVGQLNDKLKQAKVEKISLLQYIRELETALKVQREDEEL